MKKKNKKFEADVKEAELPFDLLSGFAGVIEELDRNDFEYLSLNKDAESRLSFKKDDETVNVSIHEDTLVIRHYDNPTEDTRKLRVLYVVKPAQRDFKLL